MVLPLAKANTMLAPKRSMSAEVSKGEHKIRQTNRITSVTADHGFGYALRYRRDGHDRMETYGRGDYRSVSDEESWIPMNLTVRRDHAALRGVGEMTAAEGMHRDNAIEDIPRYKG